MSNSYIEPYYQIPSSSGVIKDVEDYQTLSYEQLQKILNTDYTKSNSIEDGHAGLLSAGITNIVNAFGDGIDQDEILSAWMTSQAELESAVIEAQATCYAAEVEAMAATNAAIADANARMYEADMNYKAVQEQSKADIEIADKELEASLAETEVKAQQVQVDLERVWVEKIAAEGEAEKDKAEGEAELIEAQNEQYENEYSYLT